MRSQDYEEFVESCARHDVRYLIVGAHAVAHYARPRSTKDLDLWIDPTPENARRVLATIRNFLGSDLGLQEKDLTEPGAMVQLGVAPTRIDLLNRLAGIPGFSEAWDRREAGHYGPVDALFLSLEDLIRAKAAAGRERDLEDLRYLRMAQDSHG